MPENRAGSLIFPLLLILIGVVLLVERLGLWSLNWAHAGQWWPLILVLLGLEILLRHTRMGEIASFLVAFGLIASVMLLVLSGGPRRVDRTHNIFSYPLKGIETADVRLDVGVGRLEVSPLDDSDQVLEAEIRHSEATQLIREVSEKDKGIRIALRTSGEGQAWNPLGKSVEEDWHIGLSTQIPLSLEVHAGVNRSQLKLNGLKLKRLSLNAGVGETEVTLPETGNYEVTIKGGIGAIKVQVPESMEARVRVDGGLGAVHVGGRYEQQGKYYVTKGYAHADDRAEIEIDGGVGAITIR